MSIHRILSLFALLLFIVFTATFFTILIRLSRIGIMSERFAYISDAPLTSEPAVLTWFALTGQDKDTGRLRFHTRARIDTHSSPFDSLVPGDPVVLRIENLQTEVRRNLDLVAQFENITKDRYVTLDFGEFPLQVADRRDFYPFDGYEISFNFAYYVPPHGADQAGVWVAPRVAVIESLTNLILLKPRYTLVLPDVWGIRARVARLRMQQFLAAALILIEILFMLYLITLSDLQEIMGKGLGYIIVLYVIRNILTAQAPQFPTIVDYATLFLICVAFFLMLFRFLGGSEEKSLITLPASWRYPYSSGKPSKSSSVEHAGSEEDKQDDASNH